MGLLNTRHDDVEEKLPFRQFVKEERKAKKPEEEIFDKVELFILSKSEEWIIIEGTKSKAFINAKSKVGTGLWQTVTQFDGFLKGLKIVPAKNKLGFDLEPIDETCKWDYQESEGRCYCWFPNAKKVNIPKLMDWTKLRKEMELSADQLKDKAPDPSKSTTRSKTKKTPTVTPE